MKAKTIGIVILLTGCASTPNEPCREVACMFAQAQQEVAKKCTTDLLWREHVHRKEARRIDQTYNYPLVSWDGYSSWVRMGNTAPSPNAWCKSFAAHTVKSPIDL